MLSSLIADLRRAASIDIAALNARRQLVLKSPRRRVRFVELGIDAQGKAARSRVAIRPVGYAFERQRRGYVIPLLSIRLASKSVPDIVLSAIDPGAACALDLASVVTDLSDSENELRVRATARSFERFGGGTNSRDGNNDNSEAMRNALAAASAASTTTATAALTNIADFKHSIDQHRHTTYINTAKTVGDEHETAPELSQDKRCRIFSRKQQNICSVANNIIADAGALFARCRPDATIVPSPLVLLGCGSGMHSTFSVRGKRTHASAWTNACRLAGRGLIVTLIDEYNSSKVTINLIELRLMRCC